MNKPNMPNVRDDGTVETDLDEEMLAEHCNAGDRIRENQCRLLKIKSQLFFSHNN